MNLPVLRTVDTDWINGWKLANVYVADDLQTLQFSNAYRHTLKPYAIDDVAKCIKGNQPCISAPADNCRCGFNAWLDIEVALEHLQEGELSWTFLASMGVSLALLRVGLCGDVIEGSLKMAKSDQYWGYRASRQRVVDLFYPRLCHVRSCHDEAVCLGAKERYANFGWSLLPFCARHESSSPHVFSSEDLARHNDVDVHWDYDDAVAVVG
jgi:hypothetical protein